MSKRKFKKESTKMASKAAKMAANSGMKWEIHINSKKMKFALFQLQRSFALQRTQVHAGHRFTWS